MAAALAALWALTAPAATGTFADAWDRWKGVDAAWTRVIAREPRSQALPHLKRAATQLFSSRWSEACAALDQAWADLEGRRPSPEQAATFRFQPPAVEPGKAARLVVDWAYRPADGSPIRLRVANRELMVTPGRRLTLDVTPNRLEPELVKTPELTIMVPVQIGSLRHAVPLSIVKRFRERLTLLEGSPNPDVRTVAEKGRLLLEAGGPSDPSQALFVLLELADQLEATESRLADAEVIPYARMGATALRAAFPKGKRELPVVVIAVSGFGGENAFFECLGQGQAAAEAARRGWGFVGASESENAAHDALAWLQTRSQRKFGRYFVIGYGKGAGPALAAADAKPKPAAMAALAPASVGVLASWLSGPVYFAIGKEDVGRIVGVVRSIVTELGPRPDVKLDEFDGVEHLMLPNASIENAFAFFDRFAK